MTWSVRVIKHPRVVEGHVFFLLKTNSSSQNHGSMKKFVYFCDCSFPFIGKVALFHFHDCGRVSQTNNLSKSIQLQLIWRNVLEPGMFPHDGIHNWGGGNSNIFYFHRDPWGNDPI